MTDTLPVDGDEVLDAWSVPPYHVVPRPLNMDELGRAMSGGVTNWGERQIRMAVADLSATMMDSTVNITIMKMPWSTFLEIFPRLSHCVVNMVGQGSPGRRQRHLCIFTSRLLPIPKSSFTMRSTTGHATTAIDSGSRLRELYYGTTYVGNCSEAKEGQAVDL